MPNSSVSHWGKVQPKQNMDVSGSEKMDKNADKCVLDQPILGTSIWLSYEVLF